MISTTQLYTCTCTCSSELNQFKVSKLLILLLIINTLSKEMKIRDFLCDAVNPNKISVSLKGRLPGPTLV